MYEIPVRMPKMSMTMTEGEILTWNSAPGAQVAAGDVVCEVMTDKVDMEVEAPVSGTLVRIDFETGLVPVGTPIGWIASEEPDPLADLFGDSSAPASKQETAVARQEATAADSQTAPAITSVLPREMRDLAPPGGPRAAVPRARAMARANNIDLDTVVGTGPGSRVLVDDIERLLVGAVSRARRPETDPHPPAPPIAVVASAPVASAPVESAPVASAPVASAHVASPARAVAVRAAVARAMTASAAVPQFTLWRDLDLDAASVARSGISWTTLLLRGYVGALRHVPALLGQWDGTGVVPPPSQVSVALAVDTPYGLLAPVFTDPDRLPIEALDADVRATTSAARGGKVDAAHLLPATATLSNLGGLGVDRFQALVSPPQASVLAVGSISHRPVAVPGGLGLGLRVTVGLTVDHRVADGADGARMLEILAAAFREPLRLLGPSPGPR